MSTGHLVIRDTSPLVIYSPPLSSSEQNNGPDLSSGWVPYYTQSGFLTSNSPGTGVSQHITALDGANVSITWNGTFIVLRNIAEKMTPTLFFFFSFFFFLLI